jgi:glycosyltransferase involved in cell wall biosynthesis
MCNAASFVAQRPWILDVFRDVRVDGEVDALIAKRQCLGVGDDDCSPRGHMRGPAGSFMIRVEKALDQDRRSRVWRMATADIEHRPAVFERDARSRVSCRDHGAFGRVAASVVCHYSEERPVRIGIVTYWFNRGQGTVGRHLRSALTQLGHDTFVLARPTTDTFIKPSFVDNADVWQQPNIVQASSFSIPASEYRAWARTNRLDTVFCFQNYQFDEISELRDSGIRTVGTFMREDFGSQHVTAAREAFSDIYALTPSDSSRFAAFGLDSSYVPWGCHPETVIDAEPESDQVLFMFPGGFLSARKPVLAVIDAFRRVSRPDVRLLVKVQAAPGNVERLRARELTDPSALKRRVAQSRAGRAAVARVRGRHRGRRTWVHSGAELVESVQRDPRVRLELGDVAAREYVHTLASSDVCVTPARWEGLGLHLYEATAAGLPLIVNRLPPMNEIVEDGTNGIVVGGEVSGATGSGAEIHEVSISGLAAAFNQLADPEFRRGMREGAKKRRAELDWDTTVQGLAALLRG